MNQDNKKPFKTRVKYFINSYHKNIAAGALALNLLFTSACSALVGNKKDEHSPDDFRPGLEDHNHDHGTPIEEPSKEPVKNIEIEIKPGLIVEVDGSLFPNVDNLDNEEIKAILEDLEQKQKEEGKAPIVDPSIKGSEETKPSIPSKPAGTTPDANHEHKFGEWEFYDDEKEARNCECGEVESREHKFEHTKTSYATYSDGTHYEVDTFTCGQCGHKVYKAHKENCELRFRDYDNTLEYHICDECQYVAEVEHNMQVTAIDNNIATMACQNEGCLYTNTVDLSEKENDKPGINYPGVPDIPFHKHTFTDWSSLNDNVETRFCKGCGKLESRPHDFETVSTTYENQGDAGHKRLTFEKCKHDSCQHEKSTKSGVLGHSLVTKNNADGSTTYSCDKTGCGYTKTIQNTEHNTHKWVETSRTVVGPATEDIHYLDIAYTCTIGGELRIEHTKENCSITGGVVTTKYDDNSHWTETAGKCECGNAKTVTSPKQAHDKKVTTKYVNTGEAGHYLETNEKCSCGYNKTIKGNVTNHTLDGGKLNADGSTTYKCTAEGCGFTKVDKIEHEHDWKETGRSVKEPVGAETHNLEISYKCSCGETKSETRIVNCTMKPGPSTTNYDSNFHWTETDSKCECGNTKTIVSNKVTHSMTEWTQINDKEEQRNCTGCGHTEKRNIEHTCVWVETDRKVGSPVGDSSHNVEITYTCSCGKTKTETKTVDCSMSPTGNTVNKYDASGHWTESQVKCSCGNTKNTKSPVAPHDTSHVEKGSPVPYNESQHRIPTVTKCSCGYSSTPTYTYESHSWTEQDKGDYILYTCVCGEQKEVQKEQHGDHHYRVDSLTDNGNGTHTINYTCTNTKGTCNARTYTETVAHSFTSYPDGDIIVYRCDCGYSYSEFIDEPEPEPVPDHDHHYRNDGSKNNGDGTHTTSYTCTSTVGECDKRTYSETSSHSYSSYADGDIMVYRCECGDSYSEFIDDIIVDDNSIASVTSKPETASAKSVEDILASSKSVQDILKDAATVEDILSGTASVEDIIAAAQQLDEQSKQDDQGEAYTFRPL